MSITVQIALADFVDADHGRRKCELLPALHPVEQARYRAFRHARRRQVWLAGRELLLAALARQLPRVDAAALRSDARGAVRYGGGSVRISLSHSGNLLVAALASVPVGVDAEQSRPRACIRQAGRLFTRAEARYLRTLEPAAIQTGFYTLWTLKEAFAKAAGISLWEVLQGAEFDLHAQRVHASPPAHWNCVHARTVHGWHLAAVVQSADNEVRIECRRRSAMGDWFAENLLERTAIRSAESASCVLAQVG
ncbi:MAG: 4'-phosphopantetheinyl transferase superfamily protein [Gammaproteobacteria bacterium]|nr:4'-phosphopantetheinyl transferase superfamily protein [Gammaproteobacteria bacterium]